jgi:LCP family protein required for cell wall assembly
MSMPRTLARWTRLTVLVAAAALVVPGVTAQPAAVTLSAVETAEAVDFEDGVVWVLVLGSDAVPPADPATGLTDVIQLVGLDSTSGAAVVLGIPRDTYLDIPETGAGRINAALRDDGTAAVTAGIEQIVGITPDYVALLGVEGFADLVGVLGTIQVDNAEEFDEDGVTFPAGRLDLSPQQALAFVKHRTSLVRGEFARSANHQALLVGALARLHSLADEEGFVEAATLAALGAIDTDLTPSELYRLTQALTTIDPLRVSTCVLPATPERVDGADIVFVDPVAAERIGADAADARLRPNSCRPG